MEHALLITAWTCLSLLLEPLMKLKGLNLSNVIDRARSDAPVRHRFPEFVLWMMVVSTCGLLVWGFKHMQWYLVVAEWFVGVVLSAVISPAFDKVLLVKYGWILPLATAIGLWFLPTSR